MYDNLQLWFQLVQRFVSNTAFIEDDRVYIKEAGIVEVPVFDANVVMKLMNQHPHLLEELYAEWRLTGDEPTWNVQREFSIIVFEDMLEQDRMAEAMKAASAIEDRLQKPMEDAMEGLVRLLNGMGFKIIR